MTYYRTSITYDKNVDASQKRNSFFYVQEIGEIGSTIIGILSGSQNHFDQNANFHKGVSFLSPLSNNRITSAPLFLGKHHSRRFDRVKIPSGSVEMDGRQRRNALKVQLHEEKTSCWSRFFPSELLLFLPFKWLFVFKRYHCGFKEKDFGCNYQKKVDKIPTNSNKLFTSTWILLFFPRILQAFLRPMDTNGRRDRSFFARR